MKTFDKWISETEKKLEIVTPNAFQEARWILDAVLRNNSSVQNTLSGLLPDDIDLQLQSALHKRLSGMPLAYVIGSVPFLQHEILVEPPLLIPRPETEEWVDWLIQQLSQCKHIDDPLSILDLCSGTGCIAIALASACKNSHITATDIQEKAIETLKKNVALNALSNITILQGNFLEPLVGKKFDLIVCNPPYISKNEYQTLDASVKNWEDPYALSDMNDGLTWYKILAHEGKNFLTRKEHVLFPRIICEYGYQQGAAVQEIFLKAGFTQIKVHQDLSGKDRWIAIY